MMTRYKATPEGNIPFTAEEEAAADREAQLYAEQLAAEEAEQQKIAAAKASALAKLTALGLTSDEIKAITGA